MYSTKQHIDRMNYVNDRRTWEPSPEPPEFFPTHWKICDMCYGEGKHVNPSIDAGGLPDEYASDPDFMEDYMDGAYDVTCNHCHGSGKVKDIDHKATKEKYPDEYKEWMDYLEDEAHYQAICRAERMMGA